MVEGYNYANFLVHPTKIIVSVFNSQANPMICNHFQLQQQKLAWIFLG